ncbi:MAG: TonB family protein [Planctomycetes bacterium]|nr:TonB family protein [Planctomycetota bacterium]
MVIAPAETAAADEVEAERAPAAVAPSIALPALDLPAVDRPPAHALPPPVRGPVAPAPFALPAVALPGLPAAPVPVAGTGSAPADRPAEREGGWDLARFYPRSARRQGLRGSSSVRLAIAADGTVGAVTVERSDPPGAFDEAARRLGRSLRYRPALRAGMPVASTQLLTIDWIPP